MSIESTNETIDVEMGECVVLDGESQAFLETCGLGPCVGIAIVIKTLDSKVHRLLGHIVMEEEQSNSFEELRVCAKIINANTKDNVKDIKIAFTTTQSYRDRSNLKDDENKLIKIIKKEFGFRMRDVEFNYSHQVQIAPTGAISTVFEKAMGQESKSKL